MDDDIALRQRRRSATHIGERYRDQRNDDKRNRRPAHTVAQCDRYKNRRHKEQERIVRLREHPKRDGYDETHLEE